MGAVVAYNVWPAATVAAGIVSEDVDMVIAQYLQNTLSRPCLRAYGKDECWSIVVSSLK
jgi:hypothetical protein